MWNWFNCYLSGRHEYGMWCEPGAIFLRCIHCGRRSSGWSLDAKPQSRHDSPNERPGTAGTAAARSGQVRRSIDPLPRADARRRARTI